MSSATSSQRCAHPPLPQQTLESAPDDYSDFPPIRVLKTPEIVNEFSHELSALCSPTALSPTDPRISIRRSLRFSPYPNTQDPRPFLFPLFPSFSETVRISTTTSTVSRSETVRTAFLTQKGTGALSITSTFQGEMSNADRQVAILIEKMLELFQILVEARRRCSRG